jgi:hypothetical protein
MWNKKGTPNLHSLKSPNPLFYNALLISSTTVRKISIDEEQPCLKPLLGLKKPYVAPLIRFENDILDKQLITQFIKDTHKPKWVMLALSTSN